MPLTYDSVGTAGGASVSNIQWTHTVVGTPGLVVVVAGWLGTGTLTAATYGGTAMTTVTGSYINTSNITQVMVYISNPTAGNQTVSITRSDSNNALMGCSIAFTGGLGTLGSLQQTTGTTANPTTQTSITNTGLLVSGFRNTYDQVTWAAPFTNVASLEVSNHVLEVGYTLTAGSATLSLTPEATGQTYTWNTQPFGFLATGQSVMWWY